MSYSDFLANRGYVRRTVERTLKQPGDLVLNGVCAPVSVVPASENVVAMRRKAAR